MAQLLLTCYANSSSFHAEKSSQHPRVQHLLKLEKLKVSSTIDHLLRAVDACSTTEEIRDHAVEREPGSLTGGAVGEAVAIGYSPLLLFLEETEIGRLEFYLGAYCILCFESVSYLKYLRWGRGGFVFGAKAFLATKICWP